MAIIVNIETFCKGGDLRFLIKLYKKSQLKNSALLRSLGGGGGWGWSPHPPINPDISAVKKKSYLRFIVLENNLF